ncbi:hypothetical protein Sarmat_00302 [Rickettsiales endosymbiont of Paramecium tredecaurelia]|nr:hypothetical protein [Candidatus Sarmatiella mevalonica]
MNRYCKGMIFVVLLSVLELKGGLAWLTWQLIVLCMLSWLISEVKFLKI